MRNSVKPDEKVKELFCYEVSYYRKVAEGRKDK